MSEWQALTCLKAAVGRLEAEAARMGEELAVAHGFHLLTIFTH